MSEIRVLGVIPARYVSSRFPGKPLALIHGRPMIQWVHERASLSRRIDRLVVATDDKRIAAAVEGFGGEAVLTGSGCATGMDRCSEVVSSVPCEVAVDIQGDEPLLPPGILDRLVDSLLESPWASLTTPVRRCSSLREYQDPDCVKVAIGNDGRILYFSRNPIPSRGRDPLEGVFVHVGIYAFRRDTLLELNDTPRGKLEKKESLEQLRALEAGLSIRGIECEETLIGVDRPEDVAMVEAFLREDRGEK